MTLGPPPSAAGSSGSPPAEQASPQPPQNAQLSSVAPPPAPVPGPSVSTRPYTSQFSVQPQASRPYYGHPSTSAYSTGYTGNSSNSAPQTSQHTAGIQYAPHATSYQSQQPQTQGSQQPPQGSYPYYNYHPGAWTNAWNGSTYQYGAGSNYSYQYAQHAPQQATPHSTAPPPQASWAAAPPPPPKRKTPTPSPSPSPPPEYHKDWDAVFRDFLSAIGFSQALKGFEADMLVLNPEYERKKIPSALGDLMKDLMKLGQGEAHEPEVKIQERPLEERKLDYVHLADSTTPRSQTSITKDISCFLARNRARNDASNRNEFLLSLAEKRQRLNENGDYAPFETPPSCARTDAKTQNRDLQMKYDIAKNEDGPLRRTLKSGNTATTDQPAPSTRTTDAVPSAEKYPALDDRLQNVEKHLAVRYVPSPPRSLYDRLKYLEDHIIHLEREYPPWAALHFNQPNRGWPPPPRPTPIIVPSHLTSTAARPPAGSAAAGGIVPGGSSASSSHATPTGDAMAGSTKGKARKERQAKSSLHRAVMERLEVQKAITDLTGGDAG
ncbi:hypothetical protein C2E23DRAFT_798672 [Lenzites betulinus]|nr:hypothetical protein C2E23DRAFT_798672 [Lenzites betulinus]